MCWSEPATYSMVAIGAAATLVVARRGEPTAIWLTMGYFTAMEALQAAGYAVVDQCGDPANRAVTVLSYLHIAFQPIFINAFAMALAADRVAPRMRARVYALAALASGLLLLRLVPLPGIAPCAPGDALCGPGWCTVSGSWHIGWQVPVNDLWGTLFPFLGSWAQFPVYVLAVFALPLAYGAWRFIAFHALFGPIAAMALTRDMNEMPAIWCLFSIGLLLIGLSPAIRGHLSPRAVPA